MADAFTFAPLPPECLSDAAQVFASRRDSDNCWCCYWYRPNADYKAHLGEDNREYFRAIAEQGPPPGTETS
jgi:hypothetical protein